VDLKGVGVDVTELKRAKAIREPAVRPEVIFTREK
jgi:hypothetical protein